jgi:DNA-binding transcriptional ArsR family regulator
MRDSTNGKSEAMRSTMRITKALSDIQRVRILMLLRTGELCVCQIIAVLGLAPSTVSKHLSILSAAGLVDSRKDGRWAYFRLPQGEALKVIKPVMKWLDGALESDDSVAKDAKKREAALVCPPESLSARQRNRCAG